MINLEQFDRQFAMDPQIRLIQGEGDHLMIEIDNEFAKAKISTYGAQVLSYKPHDQDEDLIFLSENAIFKQGKSIRGGIPVCWPWFGDDPENKGRPSHGFVRNQCWQLLSSDTEVDGSKTVKLHLHNNDTSAAIWPHEFGLMLSINVGTTLKLSLSTTNKGNKPFEISQAFHTYIYVSNVKKICLIGLDNINYLDKLDNFSEKTQQGDVFVEEEIDRIYQHATKSILIKDSGFNRQIIINKENSKTAVVWNPWSESAKKMADLADDAYQRFVCVETANAVDNTVIIPPGETFILSTEYKAKSC